TRSMPAASNSSQLSSSTRSHDSRDPIRAPDHGSREKRPPWSALLAPLARSPSSLPLLNVLDQSVHLAEDAALELGGQLGNLRLERRTVYRVDGHHLALLPFLQDRLLALDGQLVLVGT